MKLSDVVMPLVNVTAAKRGEEMTIQRAKEILEENEYKIVETGRGIYAVTYDNETNIVGEQDVIDWARELEEEK